MEGHQGQSDPNRRQKPAGFDLQRFDPSKREERLENQNNANNRQADRNRTAAPGDFRAQLIPSDGFSAPAATGPGDSNYQDQITITEDQASTYNHRRPESWVTHNSEDDAHSSDTELERRGFLYHLNFDNTDDCRVSVLPPRIFHHSDNLSRASVDRFRAFRYPDDVDTNLPRPITSSRLHRLSSIKSRSGSLRSASSRRRFNVKRAAKYYWHKIGLRHKDKSSALDEPATAAAQSDNLSGQPSGLGPFQPDLEPLPESVGSRVFSGAPRSGLYPPYRNLPSTFFQNVYHEAGAFSNKQRASGSSAGNFVPPKAKRRFVSSSIELFRTSLKYVVNE